MSRDADDEDAAEGVSRSRRVMLDIGGRVYADRSGEARRRRVNGDSSIAWRVIGAVVGREESK